MLSIIIYQERVNVKNYKIKLVNKQAQPIYVTKDFKMQSFQDDDKILFKIIHCTN